MKFIDYQKGNKLDIRGEKVEGWIPKENYN